MSEADTEKLIEAASRHLWQNYFPDRKEGKRPALLVRGEGIYVYDSDGNRYLDTNRIPTAWRRGPLWC